MSGGHINLQSFSRLTGEIYAPQKKEGLCHTQAQQFRRQLAKNGLL